MKEEILQITSDLREGHITSNEAKAQLLVLFGISHRNLDELKIEWLINDTYQVLDESENVLHQGTLNDCNDYLTGYYGG